MHAPVRLRGAAPTLLLLGACAVHPTPAAPTGRPSAPAPAEPVALRGSAVPAGI